VLLGTLIWICAFSAFDPVVRRPRWVRHHSWALSDQVTPSMKQAMYRSMS
jgi:hypothetical protein